MHSHLKLHLFLTAAIASALLAACGTPDWNASPLQIGDTAQRVISLLGRPVVRQSRGAAEAWQYGRTGGGAGRDDYRVIWFYDGKVTGLTTYTNNGTPTDSTANFREIRWDDSPSRHFDAHSK